MPTESSRSPSSKKATAKAASWGKSGGVRTTTITHSAAKKAAAAEVPAPTEVPKDTPTTAARRTLLEALLKALGEAGTLLQHPHGQSFSLRPDLGDGAVHSHRTVMVRLPKAGSVPHVADLTIEHDAHAIVWIDILDSNARLSELKAHAYDAALIKKGPKRPFGVLVYVRLPHPQHTQDLVESLAHDYDVFFGINEADVVLEAKFAAALSEVIRRVGVRPT